MSPQQGVAQVGMGYYIQPIKIRARLLSTSAGGDARRGEVFVLNVNGSGLGADSIRMDSSGELFGDPGDGRDEWSTVQQLAASNSRLAYPMVVADGPVTLGSKGDFWLKHPYILVRANQSVPGNNIAKGTPITYDYLDISDRAVRPIEDLADLPDTSPGATTTIGPIRMLGWGIGTTDGAVADQAKANDTLLPMAFNGIDWVFSPQSGTGALAV